MFRLSSLPTTAGLHVVADGRCVLVVAHDAALVVGGSDDANGSVAFVRASGEGTPSLEPMGPGKDALPATATAIAAAHTCALLAVGDDATKCVTVYATELGVQPRGIVCRMALPVRALAFSPDDARM